MCEFLRGEVVVGFQDYFRHKLNFDARLTHCYLLFNLPSVKYCTYKSTGTKLIVLVTLILYCITYNPTRKLKRGGTKRLIENCTLG